MNVQKTCTSFAMLIFSFGLTIAASGRPKTHELFADGSGPVPTPPHQVMADGSGPVPPPPQNQLMADGSGPVPTPPHQLMADGSGPVPTPPAMLQFVAA
jgi:hypothetical protein